MCEYPKRKRVHSKWVARGSRYDKYLSMFINGVEAIQEIPKREITIFSKLQHFSHGKEMVQTTTTYGLNPTQRAS